MPKSKKDWSESKKAAYKRYKKRKKREGKTRWDRDKWSNHYDRLEKSRKDWCRNNLQLKF